MARHARALIAQNLGFSIIYNAANHPVGIIWGFDTRNCRLVDVQFIPDRDVERTAPKDAEMNAILYLLPISLLLAVISLIAFFWTVRRNHYQDLDGDCLSALVDEDLPLARNTVDGK